MPQDGHPAELPGIDSMVKGPLSQDILHRVDAKGIEQADDLNLKR